MQYSTAPQITAPTVSSLCPDGISPMIGIYTTATQPTEHQNDFKPEGIDRQFINDSGGQHSRSPTMYTPTVFSLGQDGQLPVISVQGRSSCGERLGKFFMQKNLMQ